jgi:formylglycine-generating enzyme required for sulfatase activity
MSRSLLPRRLLPAALLPALAVCLALLSSSPAQTPEGTRHALVVGVLDYDHAKLPSLQYTENDAEDLARVLATRGSFSVRVLTTSRGKRSTAKGKKRTEDLPTAANVRAAIKELLAKKKRGDTVLVALAGHGLQLEVKDGDGKRDESFFCPCDAQLNDTDTLIGLTKLFIDLQKCGASVKLLLVDACRNEPGSRAFRSFDASADDLRPASGVAALFSCSSGQRAFETAELPGGRGHGVFFHYVLEGLRGKAKNGRGEVTWGRLAEHVTESVDGAVPELVGGGARQTPHEIKNLQGPPPVLIPAPAKEVVNSAGMKLVRIPKGKFTMGSPAGEMDRSDSEGPQHDVEITKDFYLGVHEVTQKQFREIMGYNPSFFSSDGKGKPGEEYGDDNKPAGGKGKVPGTDTGDFPVENVSWEEAVSFCKRLSERKEEKAAGRKYRLPTEAEWEYACRGGGDRYQVFSFGDSLSSTQANFNGNNPYGGGAKGSYLERTCKAGSYKPNAWGLYDMHGNVYEWCADWHGQDYYGKSPRQDPPGPAGGTDRVVRGGSWTFDGDQSRSALRGWVPPDSRWIDRGFRAVMVPE